MLEQALNPDEVQRQEGGDWEFYSDIQSEKAPLWDMLYDMNNQLMDLQDTIGNLEYEEFSLRSRFARDDE
jgi:hypothetical protein